jgi:ATP-dependent exoDNAse (exonuclease V) beta subunit
MPQTITDEEYNHLRTGRQIADLIEPIWNNPELSPDAKRLLKRQYPHIQIPEHDIREEFRAALAEQQKLHDDEKAAAQAQAQQLSWDSDRDETKKKYGFTDEAMKEVEKIMVDKNTANYDVAATYLVATKPKPTESQFDSGRWEHEKQSDFAAIAKDPEGWGRNELMKIVLEDQAIQRQHTF